MMSFLFCKAEQISLLASSGLFVPGLEGDDDVAIGFLALAVRRDARMAL